MTLRDFLDASYALLIEEYQRIDPLKDFFSLAERINPPEAKVERAPSEREVAVQNEQSLQQLQAMLAGVAK